MGKLNVKFIALKKNDIFMQLRNQLALDFLAEYGIHNPEIVTAIDQVRNDSPNRNPIEIVKDCFSGKTLPDALVSLAEINDPDLAQNYDSFDEAAKKQLKIKVLHCLKMNRQLLWLRRLESFTCAKINDIIEQEKGRLVNNGETTLNIVALPEFYFIDINDNEKHKDDIVNYSKPFYFDNIKTLLRDSDDHTAPSLASLTIDENIILLPGTAIWKQINQDDHLQETLFNTLPIFFNGKLQMAWDKVNTSTIDGFYDESDILKKNKVPSSYRSTPSLLTPQSCSMTDPLYSYPVKLSDGTNSTITIGFDICLDFLFENLKSLNTEPMIHILIAAGMPVSSNADKIYAKNLFLRCDGGGDATRGDGDNECYIVDLNTPGVFKQANNISANDLFDVFNETIDITSN
ncbi:MAG TPA: hypothetical protein VHP81_03680 [Lachnospiraceae bacterium]|nr:hypothetical protein [Lachnospiraceae bacterium]